MFEEWMAQELQHDREREMIQQRRIHEALLAGRATRSPGAPMRVRVGRWLVASGERLMSL